MLEKLKQLENKYLELSARAEQPDFYADPARAAKFLKEQRELAPIVTAYRAWRACAQNMDEALAMMAGEQTKPAARNWSSSSSSCSCRGTRTTRKTS